MSKLLSHFSDLWDKVSSNVFFLLQFIGVIAAIFIVAYIAEKIIRKKRDDKEKIFSTRSIAVTGIMVAIAGVLMYFEFPLPFIAPPFYELDFSEIPVLVCGFAFGPVAGVMAEAVKILVKLLIKGTSTAFVGDLANFVIGCSFVLPATIIYHIKKSKKMALIGCIAGTVMISAFGTFFNAVYLLPKFAELYGMPLEAIVAAGTDIHKGINGVTTFVIMCVAPLNLIKGLAVSLVTMLIYHPLRPILKKNI